MLRHTRPAEDRFWDKVDKSAGPKKCWIWTGAVASMGYGNFGASSTRSVRSNRFAWELTYGPIPKTKDPHDSCIIHSCDNRLCCNPSHLRMGTRQDNMDDMKERDRVAHGEKAANSKLSLKMVRDIRRRVSGGEKQISIVRELGISPAQVSRIVNRTRWVRA